MMYVKKLKELTCACGCGVKYWGKPNSRYSINCRKKVKTMQDKMAYIGYLERHEEKAAVEADPQPEPIHWTKIDDALRSGVCARCGCEPAGRSLLGERCLRVKT